jgi:hypothetical protein
MKASHLAPAAVLLSSALTSASAAVLSLQPPAQAVLPGAPVQVTLTVSGLGAGTAPSLGVFDLDLLYDPAVLQFDSVRFGDPTLGDQLDLLGFGSVTAVDSAVAGVVNHFELSSDLPGDLDFLQAGAFTLSVFNFTALAPGVAALDLVIHSFGDSLGDPLAASVADGGVTVVPEPAATGLAVALGAVAWVRFRRQHSR